MDFGIARVVGVESRPKQGGVGNAGVHVAGAGPFGSGYAANRYLRYGRGALRVGYRSSALQWR